MSLPLVISCCALGFTLTSFWWLHVRRGRLVGSPPGTYACAITAPRVRLRLPLVIQNTGPAGLVIEEVALRLHATDVEWPWLSIRRTLRPEQEDFADFVSPLAVVGNSILSVVVEFGTDTAGPTPAAGSSESMTVRIRERNGGWADLTTFDLRLPSDRTIATYIAHRRLDHDC